MARITISAFFILTFSYSYFSQTGWKLYRQLPTLQESINPSSELKNQTIDSPIIPIMRTCDGIPLYKLNGVCIGKIASLVCGSGKLSEQIKSQVQVTGVTYSITYTSGNGGTYQTQELSSTGVTGLVAKLTGSNFNLGSGTLSFSISGKANSAGIAKFDLSIGGQKCSLEVTVIESVTPTSGYGPTITDVEGNVYKTVYIGPQQWMAENLKTSLYQDGSTVPQVRLIFNWANKTAPAWCYLSDDNMNNTQFGKLYNYYAITNSSQVCPIGWHIPTSFEFELLAYSLGGRSVAGGALKNSTSWQTPNVSATNSSLFSAFPGERRNNDGTFSTSGELVNNEAYFWSSTIDPKYATYAFQYALNSNTAKIAQLSILHNSAASVRCVKGTQPMTSSVFPDENVFTSKLEQPIRKNQSFSNVKCVISYTKGVRGILNATGLNGILQDITFSGQEGISGSIPAQEIVDGAGQFIAYLSGNSTVEGNVTLYFKNGGFMIPFVVKVLHGTSGNGPTIYDASGNSYPTVNIGSQQWMAKNLTTEKYNDGTLIPNVQNELDWKSTKSGAWCNYENNSVNGSNYGKLYNGFAVQTQKLCPTGWHIPTKIEWDTLFNYLGGIQVAGSKLKAVSNLFEAGANTDATNASNFSGLPGGVRNVDGAFYNLTRIGYYWSSTQVGSISFYNTSYKTFYVYYLHAYQSAVIDDNPPELRGFSVRCLKDE